MDIGGMDKFFNIKNCDPQFLKDLVLRQWPDAVFEDCGPHEFLAYSNKDMQRRWEIADIRDMANIEPYLLQFIIEEDVVDVVLEPSIIHNDLLDALRRMEQNENP